MKLLVGCPVLDREWIIERWFEHVDVAVRKAGVRPHVVMVGGSNDRTLETASVCAMQHNFKFMYDYTEEPEEAYVRQWGVPGRLEHMVYVRNALLQIVRDERPDAFLSLDSDILLHEDAIVNMFETLEDSDAAAVGGKAHLHALGKKHPTFFKLGKRGYERQDSRDAMEVDILMAVKLMLPAAFKVDYEYDSRGEDFGWSLACKRKGLKLMWDGRVCSKHVMHDPRKIRSFSPDQIDQRCGF